MKKIKVWLQYPWKFPDSPYYKYLVENPPNEIEYLNIKKQKGVIIKKSKFFFSNFLKKSIRKITVSLKLAIPNAHITSTEENYDIIHCAHCLSLNEQPWIADFEGVWQFSVSGEQTKIGKRLIRKILKKENCKKIIAWTEEAKKNILKEFPEIREKVEIIYPAIPIPKIKKKKHKSINLLFVGRYFYAKGGLHALESIDRLTKKYENVYGIIVSEVPEEIKQKYLTHPRIKIYDLMSQEQLFKICSVSDIFVYPGYSDSFGFAMLEVMSFGIPIITVDGFARKEIVEEGKTGFVIDLKREINKTDRLEHKEVVVRKIIKKTGQLIRDRRLREKMSENCIEIIENGKFSVKKRNEKLKRIYGEIST